MGIVRVAAAQYPVEWLADWAACERKAQRWVAGAAESGARLLVFPEYFSMELASLFGEAVCRSLPAQLEAMQSLREPFGALYAGLAARHGVHILAGSFPVRVADGTYRNRSWLFCPDGRAAHQDKLQMTRFEDEQWLVCAGATPRVIDTALGTLAIAVCYDVEFPLPVRAQVEAGAQILLVPSCTDTLAGWHRVRLGARARALENQCFVVQSPTVGAAPWSEAVDINTGAAGVFGPVDRGFPADGVLAEGRLDEPCWVYAGLDTAALEAVRTDGQVLNHRHWARQPTVPAERTEPGRFDPGAG